MIVTAKMKLECVQRELGWRRKVYPRRVQDERMRQKDMDYQIMVMEHIEADYVIRAAQERALTELPL